MVKITLHTLPQAAKAYWKRIMFVVVVLAAVGVAVYYFGFARLYSSDYADALQAVNRTTTAYNDLLGARDEAIAALGQEGTTFTSMVEKYRKSYNNYRSAITSINSERATRDQTVQAAYTSLQKRSNKFETSMSEQLKLLPLIQGIAVDCDDSAPSKLNISDLAKIVEVYDDAMGKCANAMKSLAKSDDTAAAKRATEAVAYFDAMRAHAVAMQAAYGEGNRSVFESEYNALLDALAQYKTYIQVRDLLDIAKDVAPTTELNALATILSQRQK